MAPLRDMMIPIDPQSMWDDEFCDITIKFSGRELKAHRFLVCKRLTYFGRLCGPKSSFAEANAEEVTLKDDDPDALTAMFRYLYCFEYTDSQSASTKLKIEHHFNCMVVADKYGAEGLAAEASAHFDTDTIDLMDSTIILELLELATEHYGDHAQIAGRAEGLAKAKLRLLKGMPKFHQWVATQPKLCEELFEDAIMFQSLKQGPGWFCGRCAYSLDEPAQCQCIVPLPQRGIKHDRKSPTLGGW